VKTIYKGEAPTPFVGIGRITIGRGSRRQTFQLPHTGVEREKSVEQLKNFAARPELLRAATQSIIGGSQSPSR
jgi:hypothetical protein